MGSDNDDDAQGGKTTGHKAREWFKFTMKLFKLLVIIACLFCCVAKVLTMHAACKSSMGVLEKSFLVIAETGFLLIAILLILAEIEPKWFIRMVWALHFWFWRGFVLSWLGVQTINSTKQLIQTLKQFQLGGVNDAMVNIFCTAVGWVLISIGITYIVLSLLCIRAVTKYGTNMEELESGLLGGEKADDDKDKKSKDTNKSSAADKDTQQLIANMSKALGVKDAKDAMQYYGPKAKKQPPPIPGTGGINNAGGGSYKPPESSNEQTNKRNEPSAPSADTYAYNQPSSSHATAINLDDGSDDDRRRKNFDDDDLDAAYYGRK